MTKIDYIKLLQYLENNIGKPYVKPSKAPDIEKDKYIQMKAEGQGACKILKNIAELCSSRFSLNRYEPISWLDGSNTKVRNYMWLQMKYSEGRMIEPKPFSVSVFVELHGTGKAVFRVSLEIKNDGAKKETLDKYHTALEIPLKQGLVYVSGSNEFGRPEIVDESQAEIIDNYKQGKYSKIQICRYVEQRSGVTNDYYEKEILDSVEALLPYYRKVLDVPASFDLTRLNEVLESYKKQFNERWSNESFKWIAVENFQKEWDIDTLDFSEMLKKSLKGLYTLVYNGNGSPVEMICQFAKEEPDKVRNLFKDLYDEDENLTITAKIKNFIDVCDTWIDEKNSTTGKQDGHKQDNNVVSLYLWLRYPDKYYLYKSTVVTDFAKYIKADYLNGSKSPESQFYFYNDVKNYVKEDDELIGMLQNKLIGMPFFENSIEKAINTMIVDIGFHASYYIWGPEGYVPKKEDGKELSSEEWVKLLTSNSVKNNHSYFEVLKRFLDNNGIGSPLELSNKYGGSWSKYRNVVKQLGINMHKDTNCTLYNDGIKDRYWPVGFFGRNAGKTEEGTFVFKMRPALVKALSTPQVQELLNAEILHEEKAFEDHDNIKEGKKIMDKNVILYGPPGTGKTYNTVIKAVDICDADIKDRVKPANYAEYLKRYRELVSEERIAFTTFHQSYGYEEFVEGLKPSQGNNLVVEPGVFKKFCDKAKETIITSEDNEISEDARVWYIRLGGKSWYPDLLNKCVATNCIRLGWKMQPERIESNFTGVTTKELGILLNFQEEIEVGDTIVTAYSKNRIGNVGVVTSDYLWDPEGDAEAPRKRTVKWLATNIDEDIQSINKGTNIQVRNTLYALDRISIGDIVELVKKNNPEALSDVTVEKANKSNVFIIDEINRGNISKIFGELITLIEPSKRQNADESMSVVLPYSHESFSVPDNVYILGTMNTADRSLALLDTALRRRFSFEEMMPNIELLDSIKAISIGDNQESLDVSKMLETINKRIVFLYDREHTIGHAYFMALKDSPTINTLADIFAKKVIPLLQEYFYDDFEKIQLVLADNDKKGDLPKFLEDVVLSSKLFRGTSDYIDNTVKEYKINETALTNIECYRHIYEGIQ